MNTLLTLTTQSALKFKDWFLSLALWAKILFVIASFIIIRIILSIFEGVASVEITAPQNNSSVTSAQTEITGKVSPTDAKLLINKSPTVTNPDGSFKTTVALKEGKNEIEVRANKTYSNNTQTLTITRNLSESEQREKEKQSIVFDIGSLYGKNIDEIRVLLGKPTDAQADPTPLQLKNNTTEWSNSFKKKEYELLVTYNPTTRKVIDFFVSTDNPTGQDLEKLKSLLHLQPSEKFTIEPIKMLKDPKQYTGIKITTK